MKRPQHIAFWIFSVFFCLSMLAGICELLGVSVCLFGTPLHGRLAVPICLSFLALTVCVVRALKRRRQTAENPHLYRLLSVCVSVACAALLLISIPLSLLTATSYADSRLSDDHAYKVFFEDSTDSDEPIALSISGTHRFWRCTEILRCCMAFRVNWRALRWYGRLRNARCSIPGIRMKRNPPTICKCFPEKSRMKNPECSI